ncbi:response regulator [Pseudomonas sp. ZM23]|uniref:HDOD domain-containing protein n=1 Tax=Pseudomonas triclosanedens TaxID=2961893 RepID=A0ABY6ZZF9_9PSED|nr:HDOD domain-containing protein [Pseudomonas triclosanedens]MCP8462805.1 response regulator [Pseudomonas triclosanedens]MCP8468425.1 response regulator [Pseudomonas triclosanedens]MCP8475146.1 response regulator [Pseudomonas triclosanedens]WAI49987.1 HDOD domain-containing protein [Pseudomonas triclosanedens]
MSASPGVLVAASDPWSRELLSQLVLSVRCDASVQFCEDGVAAIEACRRQPYALILAERELAGSDGLELLRQVRALRRGPTAHPFILISSKADAASVRAALPLAPTAYLVKPFNAENLRERLRALLLAPGENVVCELPALEQSLSLERYLQTERDATDGAPLMGAVGLAVNRCMEAADVSLEMLEQEFGHDPQITACLISAANSAARHVGMPCQTLLQALSRLGVAHALNLMLAVALQRAATLDDSLLKERAERFWQLSQRSADSAFVLAESLGADADRCFTAGLLHCLGDLALLRSLQDWRSSGGALSEEEVDRALREHGAGFGSALRTRWRLPLELRNLIAAAYAIDNGVFSREALIVNLAASAARLSGDELSRLRDHKATRMLQLTPEQLRCLGCA